MTQYQSPGANDMRKEESTRCDSPEPPRKEIQSGSIIDYLAVPSHPPSAIPLRSEPAPSVRKEENGKD